MTIMKVAQRGALLIAAVVLIAVIAVLASALSFLQVGSTTSGGDHLRSAQALFVAESGLEYAAYRHKDTAASVSCELLSFTESVGVGIFTTAGTLYNTSSTLNSVLTAADTAISLSSTSGFGARGRVTIVSSGEAINYAAKTAAQLTGAKRGMMGTAPAASYPIGTAVTQNQCMVTSTGTVGLAVRRLEGAVLPP